MLFSFEDYMKVFMLPAWIRRHGAPRSTLPEEQLREMIATGSLTSLESFLKDPSSNVYVVTNANDFLLRSQDVNWLHEVFGSRLVLNPTGGHGGNLWFEPMQKTLIHFLSEPSLLYSSAGVESIR